MNRLSPAFIVSLLLLGSTAWSQPGGDGPGPRRRRGMRPPPNQGADQNGAPDQGAAPSGRPPRNDSPAQADGAKAPTLGDGTGQAADSSGAPARDDAQAPGDHDRTPGDRPALRGSGVCRGDVKKFCAGEVRRGREAVKACIDDHMAEVSKACRDQITKRRAQVDGADPKPPKERPAQDDAEKRPAAGPAATDSREAPSEDSSSEDN